MKVGFVLDDRFDVQDGVQQYTRTIGAWLSEQGHDVRYLVAGDSSANSDVLVLSKTTNIRFNKNRVRLVKPISVSRASATLEREQFDVLHVQMPYAPWFAGQIIRATSPKTAIVGTFHVVLDSKMAAFASRGLRPLYVPTLKKFSAICSVSEAARAYLRQSLGISSCIIPNAVAVERFMRQQTANRQPGKHRIVFLGRLVERKGAKHLIRAFALMPDLDGLELYIVGDGPLRASLEKLSKELNIEQHTHFTGSVSEEEKAAYLHSASLAVFPATGGESFGIVLIEAMAAGAGVVLGGDNPGYACVLGKKSATLFAPSNHQGLAHLMQRILADPTLQTDLHKQQQQLVKRFSVETVGQNLLKFYRRAMNTPQKVA